MSTITWCVAGSLIFSIVEILSQRQSFTAAWRSRITWLLIIFFCLVNALLANLISYFVYETTIVIESQCNTTFSKFVKFIPEQIKYFLGGSLLYPIFLNLKITEIVTDVGKKDIGILSIYKILKDFIFDLIDSISRDCKYKESEKYLGENPQASFDDLRNQAIINIRSNTRISDQVKNLGLEKIEKYNQQYNQQKNTRNLTPDEEKSYKRNLVYIIKFNTLELLPDK